MNYSKFFEGKRESSQPVLLSFSGIDGAGKTTQIENLCQELSGRGWAVTRLAFWDNVVAFPKMRARFSHSVLGSESGVAAPHKPVARNDKNTQFWALSLLRSGLYLADAVKLRLAVEAARQKRTDFIVFDRYIYDQLATLPVDNLLTRAYIGLIARIVPKPDVAYVLDAIPEEARARKPEYPLDFMHRYRQSYLKLAPMVGLSVIPPVSMMQAEQAIFSRLEQCLSQVMSQTHASVSELNEVAEMTADCASSTELR